MKTITLTAYSKDGDQITSYSWDGSDRLVIGKSSSCHFTIKNKYISRQHGLLILRDETLVYFDLDSLNGTYVDGEPIEHMELASGDRFRIGPITIHVLVEAREPSEEKKVRKEKKDSGEGTFPPDRDRFREPGSDPGDSGSESSLFEQSSISIHSTDDGGPFLFPYGSNGIPNGQDGMPHGHDGVPLSSNASPESPSGDEEETENQEVNEEEEKPSSSEERNQSRENKTSDSGLFPFFIVLVSIISAGFVGAFAAVAPAYFGSWTSEDSDMVADVEVTKNTSDHPGGKLNKSDVPDRSGAQKKKIVNS